MNTERSIYDVFGKAVLKWPDRPFLNVLPEPLEFTALKQVKSPTNKPLRRSKML